MIQHILHNTQLRIYSIGLLVLLTPTFLFSPIATTQSTTQSDGPSVMGQPLENSAVPQIDWLEPRGLSIVNLVGHVPEEYLQNAIVAYRSGYGLVQYVSGERNGNRVTINTKMTPRYWLNGAQVSTRVGCLGQMGVYDEWPGAVPASTMRLFANGTDITHEAVYGEYTYAGQIAPEGDVSDYFRYGQFKGSPTFTADKALSVPANMGCTYVFRGQHTNLTAQFIMEDRSPIQVTTLGSESFTFHSYIGAGNAGQVDSLNKQMQGRFGNRHDKFTLSPPEGAEYFLVTYPPTPVEPYPDVMIETNVALAGGGTYRIGRSNNDLSVDHVASMAMPLHGQWQDADQSDGEYLSFFSDGVRLGSPEYFVPAGIGYNPCMTSGGCSTDLLDQIYNTEMQITIHYYQITRTADGLTRIPLRQVGSRWKTTQSLSTSSLETGTTTVGIDMQRLQDEFLYLPIIANQPPPTPAPTATPQLPIDDPTGCPCGWFDSIGRMFDYIAPQ